MKQTDHLHLMQVHFDVTYRTLDVVSTRSARLLGGNRSVAEVSFKHKIYTSLFFIRSLSDPCSGAFEKLSLYRDWFMSKKAVF